MVIELWAELPEFYSGQEQGFFLFATASRPIQRIHGFYPGVKRPGPVADNLPPSSAEVKNTLTYTSS